LAIRWNCSNKFFGRKLKAVYLDVVIRLFYNHNTPQTLAALIEFMVKFNILQRNVNHDLP